MEMSNSDVKIEKSNLLQKYIYIYQNNPTYYKKN